MKVGWIILWADYHFVWRQHPTKQQLYGHQPTVRKTIKVRRSRHAEHSRRSREKLISNILLWTPSVWRAKEGRPARTYIQQLCVDTGYSLEDLQEEMDDRNGWQERVREINASGATWWSSSCLSIIETTSPLSSEFQSHLGYIISDY